MVQDAQSIEKKRYGKNGHGIVKNDSTNTYVDFGFFGLHSRALQLGTVQVYTSISVGCVAYTCL